MTFQFPDNSIPWSKKDEKYLLEWCQAISAYGSYYPMSSMRRNRRTTIMGVDSRFTEQEQGASTWWVDENRRYAMGAQSTTQFRQKFVAGKGEAGEDFSYVNIDFRIEAFLPKLMRIVLKRVLAWDMYTECTALDNISTEEEDRAYSRAKAKIRNKKDLAIVRGMIGLPQDDESMDGKPQTLEELEVFRQAGNMKSSLAMSAEMFIDMMLYFSEWEDIKRNAIGKDLIPVGKIAVQVRTGADGVPYAERVPPEELVLPWTQSDNYSDGEWVGRVHEMSWNKFRNLAMKKGMTEEKARKMFDSGESVATGDTRLIRVVEAYILDTMPLRAKVRNSPGGREARFMADNEDYKPEPGSTGEKYEQDVNIVWEVMWVQGADSLVYGEVMKDMPRLMNNLSATALPIKVVCPGINGFDFMSVIDNIKPLADSLQELVLKKRQIASQIGPDGLAVYDFAVNHVLDGKGGAYDTNTSIMQYNQTGLLILGGTDPETGKPIYNPIGVQSIPRNEHEKLAAIINVIGMEYARLMDELGITPATAATATDPKTLNGALQLQAQGTDTALGFIVDAVNKLQEMVSKDMFARLQASYRTGKIDETRLKALGKEFGTMIMKADGLDLAELGIKVRAGMSAEERADLKEAAKTQLMVRSQFKSGGIKLEDYILVMEQKNIKLAYRLLALRTSMREKEDAEREAAQQQTMLQQTQMQIDGKAKELQDSFMQKMQMLEKTNELKTNHDVILLKEGMMADITKIREQISTQVKADVEKMLVEYNQKRAMLPAEAAQEASLIRVQGQEDRLTEKSKPVSETSGK